LKLNRKNDVNGIYWFHFPNLRSVLAYLCTQLAQLVQIRNFMCDWSIYRLFVLNTGWRRDSLQMMIFVNVHSTCIVVDLKTCFETWIRRNDVKNVNLFPFSYLITLMAYLCSQCAPNVQIMYSTFGWSIYRLFVLNRGWKLDILQMMILVDVCSTCCTVEIKTRIVTWKQRIK
jgi:hypothetical protein